MADRLNNKKFPKLKFIQEAREGLFQFEKKLSMSNYTLCVKRKCFTRKFFFSLFLTLFAFV